MTPFFGLGILGLQSVNPNRGFSTQSLQGSLDRPTSVPPEHWTTWRRSWTSQREPWTETKETETTWVRGGSGAGGPRTSSGLHICHNYSLSTFLYKGFFFPPPLHPGLLAKRSNESDKTGEERRALNKTAKERNQDVWCTGWTGSVGTPETGEGRRRRLSVGRDRQGPRSGRTADEGEHQETVPSVELPPAHEESGPPSGTPVTVLTRPRSAPDPVQDVPPRVRSVALVDIARLVELVARWQDVPPARVLALRPAQAHLEVTRPHPPRPSPVLTHRGLVAPPAPRPPPADFPWERVLPPAVPPVVKWFPVRPVDPLPVRARFAVDPSDPLVDAPVPPARTTPCTFGPGEVSATVPLAAVAVLVQRLHDPEHEVEEPSRCYE